MKRHHVLKVRDHIPFVGEPFYETLYQRHTFYLMFVCMDTSVLFRCGHGLPKIMCERKQHESIRIRHLIAHGSCSVEHFHCVCPDIAFRMENRVLLKAYEKLELRKPCMELIHYAEFFKEDGRLVCLQKGLF